MLERQFKNVIVMSARLNITLVQAAWRLSVRIQAYLLLPNFTVINTDKKSVVVKMPWWCDLLCL